MPVLRGIGLLAQCLPEQSQGNISGIENAALAWRGDQIVWLGPESALPDWCRSEPDFDAQGRLVVPGLVDCHTHLAFGGWRSNEFELRLSGRSYQSIAQAGGGILATMRATRQASVEELTERARGHLRQMAQLGVTTVEAKTGYGLSAQDELKLLEVYRRVAAPDLPAVIPTFLGAHTVPPEYADNREGYLKLITGRMLPEIAAGKLAKFCDVFVEETAFTVSEAREILRAGAALGLVPKLHADQLSWSGGAELAAAMGAASADHLEFISEQGIDQMAASGVVAVSLPIAALYLGSQPLPARRLLKAGVPVAVATDFNPGSAPSFHLHLAMTLACTVQRMTPGEVLRGVTSEAARALRMTGTIGSLAVGGAASFAVIDAPDPSFWIYHFRPNTCIWTVRNGVTIWRQPGF